MKPSPRTAMPSAVDPAPLAGVAEEPPVEAERDAAPLAAEPKPLCRSPTALRAEGVAASALLGATELAKTVWPPLLVTPAVAPWARASNRPADTPAPAPAAGATSPVAPAPLPPVAPLLPRLSPTAPLVPPLAPLSAGAGAVEAVSAGAGAGCGLGGAGAGAGAGEELGGTRVPPAVGGAVPDAGGVPKPSGEQAQARLAPVTAVASNASTDRDRRRARLFMRNRPICPGR